MGRRGGMFQGVSISLQISGKSRARSARGPILWGGHAQRGAPCSKGWKNSARSSRGWKKKFQGLETWPRRGGIAERCNAEGRNRRRRNPAGKPTSPPAREPERRRRNSGGIFSKAAAGERVQGPAVRLQKSGRNGRFTECVEEDSPPRKGCCAGTEELGPEKTLGRYSGLGFLTGSALE